MTGQRARYYKQAFNSGSNRETPCGLVWTPILIYGWPHVSMATVASLPSSGVKQILPRLYKIEPSSDKMVILQGV